MTVAELIEQLTALDPAKTVQIADASEEGMTFDAIEVVDGDVVSLNIELV